MVGSYKQNEKRTKKTLVIYDLNVGRIDTTDVYALPVYKSVSGQDGDTSCLKNPIDSVQL